jgi:hypothetical protein
MPPRPRGPVGSARRHAGGASDQRMLQLAMASFGETHHRLAPACAKLAAE